VVKKRGRSPGPAGRVTGEGGGTLRAWSAATPGGHWLTPGPGRKGHLDEASTVSRVGGTVRPAPHHGTGQDALGLPRPSARRVKLGRGHRCGADRRPRLAGDGSRTGDGAARPRHSGNSGSGRKRPLAARALILAGSEGHALSAARCLDYRGRSWGRHCPDCETGPPRVRFYHRVHRPRRLAHRCRTPHGKGLAGWRALTRWTWPRGTRRSRVPLVFVGDGDAARAGPTPARGPAIGAGGGVPALGRGKLDGFTPEKPRERAV